MYCNTRRTETTVAVLFVLVLLSMSGFAQNERSSSEGSMLVDQQAGATESNEQGKVLIPGDNQLQPGIPGESSFLANGPSNESGNGSEGEDYESMFDEMESSKKEEKEPDNFLEEIWNNRDFTVNQLFKAYFHDPRRDRQRDTHFISVSNLTFSSDVTIGNHKFVGEFWLEGSNLSEAYDQSAPFSTDQSETRNHFHLNQLYDRFSFENSDLTIGKQKIEIGVSTLYSPLGRFNRRDVVDPPHPREEGVWAAGWAWYREKHRFRAFWMPIFERSRKPPDTSRWTVVQPSSGTFNNNFMNLSGNSQVELPSTNPEDWQYMVDYKYTLPGWDFIAMASHKQFGTIVEDGPGTRLDKRYFEVFNAGAGLSTTTFDNWKLYQEALFQTPYHEEDDQFIKGVTGAEYKWNGLANKLKLNSAKLTAEIAYEGVTAEPDNPDLINSSRDSRPGRQEILARFVGEEVDGTKYILGMNLNDDKDTNSYSAAYKTELTDRLNLNVWFEIYSSDEDSQLEGWEDNDRLLFNLEYEL